MVYYLNELSITSPYCAANNDDARIIMQNFVDVCRKVAKIGFDQLRYEIRLKGICLSTNYYVESWLKDDEVEKEIKDRFRGIANQFPYLEENEEIPNECLYECENSSTEPLGLKLAYFKKTIAVSFLTHQKWDRITVGLIELCDDLKIVQVRHLANPNYFTTLKRVFEFNPKHGKCGKREQADQSKMYCCSIEEAETLLNTAIEHPLKNRWFCNYDKANQRFVVFLPHDIEHNKFHGFHYENQSNSDPDRDLNNPQNGIPKHTQDWLKNRT